MSTLSKAFRYTAFGVLTLVLAGLLALSYLVMTFEPDDYRDDLINLVEEQTGRAFTIDGNLELHLDPPLVGFEVHDISFDNPAGFGQEPMLTAKRVEAYLQVIPLLLGDLKIHSVRLDGLQLRLRRKSNGHTNWAGLVGGEGASRSEAGPGAGGAAGIDLAEVRLTDSTIAIWDELRNRRMRASNLSLDLKDLTAGGRAHVELDGELMAWLDTRAENRINAQVRMATDLTLKRGGEKITGDDLNMTLELTGPAFAFTRIGPTIRARSFQWDQASDTLHLDGAEATVEGAQLRFAPLEVKSLSEKPELTGHVEGTGVDVLHWLALWNHQVPALEDPTALRFLKWESDLRIHPRGVHLSGLDAMLDSTSIQGEISLLDFDRPRLALDLQVGEVNLDRYLPQEQMAEDEDEAGSDDDAPPDGLPVDWLREQRLVAKVGLERLHWQGLEFSETHARLTADQGHWEVESLNGQVNDGKVQAGAELDVSGGIPLYRLDLKLDQLELGRMLALFDEDGHTPIEGTTDLDLALNARGHRPATVWPSLTGFISLTVRNGVLQVGGVARAVEAAIAALQERPSETTSQGKLPFDLLLASWDANDGRLTSRELKMDAGAISLDGLGYIDLPDSSVDYQLNVWSGDSLRIPVRIRGPFDDLSHSVDMSSLVQEQLEKGLDKGLKSLVDEVEEKVEEKVKKQPAKVLRKLIKDLF